MSVQMGEADGIWEANRRCDCYCPDTLGGGIGQAHFPFGTIKMFALLLATQPSNFLYRGTWICQHGRYGRKIDFDPDWHTGLFLLSICLQSRFGKDPFGDSFRLCEPRQIYPQTSHLR